MKSFCHTFALLTVMFVFAACSAPAASPQTPVPTATVPATNATPTATVFVSSSDGGRRAPTLAPTATATEVLEPTPTTIPSATALPSSTATTLPSATARVLPTNTRPNALPTPQLAAGVYVTSFQIDPPAPKSKPSEFLFHVSFLNTVGENVNYPRWRVLILPKGQSRAVGDPQGRSKTIVNGASKQMTEAWSINVNAVCESFVAQPVWENEDGKQTPFPQPDGKIPTIEFQVCP
jgi:hypothetical protein